MMDTAPTQSWMRYAAARKRLSAAYLLLAIGGLLGAHRFYLRRTGTAVLLLVITLMSLPWALVFWGWAGLFVTLIWAALDALRLPGMVERFNTALAARLA